MSGWAVMGRNGVTTSETQPQASGYRSALFHVVHNRHFEQVILNLLQLANPIAQARGTIFALRLSL